MPLAKTALQPEPTTIAPSVPANNTVQSFPARQPNVRSGGERVSLRPVSAEPSFLPRVPVIIGEATYRGYLPINGIISGQLSASGGMMTIKQRPRNTRLEATPELDGEICFKDMLRVNGHIAGKVVSQKGTLIIDESAQVDAQIEVAVALVSGTVNGEIIARERVELGLGAVINGNISTPKLSIKPGAIFHGDCRMVKEEFGT